MQGFVQMPQTLANVHRLHTGGQGALAQAVQKEAALLTRGLAAGGIGLGQLAQQAFLRIGRERTAVVLAGTGFRVAVDHVQQFQRRAQTLRGPGGVVGHMVGKSGLVHTGEHFVVGVHIGSRFQ